MPEVAHFVSPQIAQTPALQQQMPPPVRRFLSRESLTALLAIVGIATNLILHFVLKTTSPVSDAPLLAVLILGGGSTLFDLAKCVLQKRFGSDLLAGISIIVSVIMHQYLAGSLVVLMLSGGQTLEAYALNNASSVLRALAKRMPRVVHILKGTQLVDVPLESTRPYDKIVVLPHEICPADATVLEGNGTMDESFLTGEPYRVDKAPGSTVLSGAINGESPFTLQVDRAPADSRYASIMRVMREAEQQRPQMRRIADRLGAWYTPTAVGFALLAWIISGVPERFLAVLVVATPCPLLIAIPVAIIGTISSAARRGIIIRDPAVLEKIDICKTVFFDKTGTLTYGRPRLELISVAANFTENQVLSLAAALEQYSRHPLAQAVVQAAKNRKLFLLPATNVSELPGQGLTGRIDCKAVKITGRSKVGPIAEQLPLVGNGLECVVLINGRYAATFQFLDEPRSDVHRFVKHLGPKHHVMHTVLLTGDRLNEANRMAKYAGIDETFASQSPEQKLEIVRAATRTNPTLYLGDGVNDAPAMLGATAAIAFGSSCDVTSEAAGAVILDPSLRKLDELMHISRRLRNIAFQSAAGGMALSLIAMAFAAIGWLPPVAGALLQELIDLAAVLNALRAALTPNVLSDLDLPL